MTSKRTLGELPDGRPVDLYELANGTLVARLINYGAILTELHVPDQRGQLGDVVLGFDTLNGYLGTHPYLGATIGRVGNRIANSAFSLAGVTYSLAANNGLHSLHGGLVGFDKVLWDAHADPSPTQPAVHLKYLSVDGEEAYPGNLTVDLTYRLTENSLVLSYRATTDQSTLVNLTHHSYFNLAGPEAGSILDHRLTLEADAYTPSDASLIPTGEICNVPGTPFDFRSESRIGDRIDQVTGEPGGYDHNFVLRPTGKSTSDLPRLAATVHEPTSGRILELLTTEPGVQFYTGNFLDGTVQGKQGIVYRKHQGFCLEAQKFPDAVHHPQFPSIVLNPGEVYRQETIYRFRQA